MQTHIIGGIEYKFQEAIDKTKYLIDNQVTYTSLTGHDFEFVKDLFNHHPTIKRNAEIQSICVSQKMNRESEYHGEMMFRIKFLNETKNELINGSECVDSLFNGPQTSL